MGAERHDDIVARVSRAASGSTSTGALAAHLARSCGHVQIDSRVIQQGYRFHAELSDEIPAFFNRRMSTGTTSLSITLQGGFDPEHAQTPGVDGSWATDPFVDCRTTADARRVIEAEDFHASVWRARITIGNQLLDVSDVSDPLFIARHPNEFRLVAEELIGLGVLPGHQCPLCGD